jgi:hypothetical protein
MELTTWYSEALDGELRKFMKQKEKKTRRKERRPGVLFFPFINSKL